MQVGLSSVALYMGWSAVIGVKRKHNAYCVWGRRAERELRKQTVKCGNMKKKKSYAAVNRSWQAYLSLQRHTVKAYLPHKMATVTSVERTTSLSPVEYSAHVKPFIMWYHFSSPKLLSCQECLNAVQCHCCGMRATFTMVTSDILLEVCDELQQCVHATNWNVDFRGLCACNPLWAEMYTALKYTVCELPWNTRFKIFRILPHFLFIWAYTRHAQRNYVTAPGITVSQRWHWNCGVSLQF